METKVEGRPLSSRSREGRNETGNSKSGSGKSAKRVGSEEQLQSGCPEVAPVAPAIVPVQKPKEAATAQKRKVTETGPGEESHPCNTRKSARLIATVERVSTGIDKLSISRKSEGAQDKAKQQSKTAQRQSAPGGARSSRSARPSGEKELNAEKLVMSALGDLHSRRGVSLKAIERHIATRMGPRATHWRPYVRIFLRRALKNGKLTHHRGKGLSGSFKIPPKDKTTGQGATVKRATKPNKMPKKSGKRHTKVIPAKTKSHVSTKKPLRTGKTTAA